MKNIALILTAAFLTVLQTSCIKQATNKRNELQFIFSKGNLGPAQNFTGNSWSTSLVANE